MTQSVKWFLLGLSIGYLLAFNWMYNNVNYRISLYGYTMKDGKPVPVIKLRHHDIGYPGAHVEDEAVELEMDTSKEFTDHDFELMMIKKYCGK